MDIMGYGIEAAVLSFQHGGNGRGKLSAHSPGEPGLDLLQIGGHQDPQGALRQEGQMLLLRNHVEDVISVNRLGQLLPEQRLGDILILSKAQIVLASKYFSGKAGGNFLRKGALAGAAFTKYSDYHNSPFIYHIMELLLSNCAFSFS